MIRVPLNSVLEFAVTAPSNLLPPDDDSQGENPESLQGVARRLQAAIDEALVVKMEADNPASSATSSDEIERDLLDRPHVDATGSAIDRRLYFPNSEGWELRVKSGAKDYCSRRNPDEEWFHLLVDGELFLQFADEKVCLNCAFRSGLLTDDRLFWQKGHRRQRIFPLSDSDPKVDAPTDSPSDFRDQLLTAECPLERPIEGPK